MQTYHSILDTINPILQECGILVTQHPHDDEVLVTTIYHVESGEFMQSEQVLRMKDANNPQQQGSASLTQDVMHLLLYLTLTRKTTTQTLRVATR
jgi:ABC-type uncharacterized transport system ATPase subunit